MSEVIASRSGERVRTVLAFAVAAGLVLLYALRGGTYDIVTRQEVGLALWWVVGLGWALGLFPLAGTPRRSRWALGALAALAAWTAASLLWSDSAERTFAEVARVAGYGGLLALVASVAARASWRPAAAGLSAGAVLVCGLAVADRLDPGGLATDYVGQTFGLHRLSYPLGYWNAVGAWGAMTIAALLAWSAHARTAVARALALATLPVAAAATYFAFSRASLVGVALAVLVTVALGPRRFVVAAHALAAAAAVAVVVLVARGAPAIENGTGGAGEGKVVLALLLTGAALGGLTMLTARLASWRIAQLVRSASLRRRLLVAAVGVAAVAAILAGPPLAARAWRDFKSKPLAAATDPAARLTSLASARYEFYRDALSAFTSHPALGLGAGDFQFWHDQRARDPTFARDGHSLYLESLAELGVPGLALVLVLLGTLLNGALRARSRMTSETERGAAGALIAVFVVFLWQAGVDWMWESTAVGALALGGIALAAVPGARRGQRRPGLAVRAAVVAVAVVCALVELPGLVSTSEARRSAEALRAGAPARALAAADDAVAAEPWSASALVARALVQEATGALDGARADLERAIVREPDDWSHRLVLARVEAERGHAAAALAAFEQARRLRPLAQIFARPAR